MSDHLVMYVDRMTRPKAVQPVPEPDEIVPLMPREVDVTSDAGNSLCSSSAGTDVNNTKMEQNEALGGEEMPLIQAVECRICQEEEDVKNLETPCACSGSLKFAHRKCVQHWCNEKGDIICEICHQPICSNRRVKHGYWSLECSQPYQPGYTAPSLPPQAEEIAIDIGGGWTISGTPLDLHDPRLLAIAEAERRFLEAEYDEYASSNSSGASFCRSAALIFMALLLLRHSLSVTDPDGDDDASAFFSIFLLRAAGFLLPCYIMAWAISILQRRRQRQEAAVLAATQVAFVLQSGQHRGLQFTLAPGQPATSNPEAV